MVKIYVFFFWKSLINPHFRISLRFRTPVDGFLQIYGFYVLRPFRPLKPLKTTPKEVPGVVLEVLEVVLEVLDLSWRPWGRRQRRRYVNFHHGGLRPPGQLQARLTQVSYVEFLGAPHCLVKNTVALREG